MMASADEDWPPAGTLAAQEVGVAATVRDDEPQMVLQFTDAGGVKRSVQFSTHAAWQLLTGVTAYLRQVCRP